MGWRDWLSSRPVGGGFDHNRSHLTGLGPDQLLATLAPEQAIRRLELTIARRLDGYLRGEHLGTLPGPGTVPAEAREYRPGEDDVRHMDWAVTARTTVPHIRDVISDRELETWALVDLSPSMDFGTEWQDKRELALKAVATIGILSGASGDRFGGLLYTGQRCQPWPARAGRLSLYAFLRAILTHKNPPPSKNIVTQELGEAILALHTAQRRRGLRVVVSDFAYSPDDVGPAPHWERPLRRLVLRHQTLVVQISDARERQMPDVGVVDFLDPESGEVIEIDTSSTAVRDKYQQTAIEHDERIAAAVRRSGASHLVLSTDSDWVLDMARFMKKQRHLGQLIQPRRSA